MPITPENIDMLEKEDAIMILNESNGLVDDEEVKKNSTSKSTQS
jgi:hypothetical protein